MKVINPLGASALSASSIAEPDLTTGETVWNRKGGTIATPGYLIHRIDYSKEENKFYCTEEGGNEVLIFDSNFLFLSSFSVAVETSDLYGVTVLNGFIWALSRADYGMYKYTIDGVFTGIYYQLPNGGTPTAIGNDFYNLVIGYDGSLLWIVTEAGFLASNPSVDLGAGYNDVSGIQFSDKGVYLLAYNSNASQRELHNIDTALENSQTVVVLPGASPLYRGLCAYGDVLYSGAGVLGVVQTDYAGAEVWGHPQGVEVINTTTHKKYISNYANQLDPSRGNTETIPPWTEIGSSNKYSALDSIINRQSTAELILVQEFEPGVNIDTVACFNISGVDEITVSMDDPIDGNVYTRILSMVDEGQIGDWLQWLFYDFQESGQFVLTDLPFYKDATTTITFEGSGAVGVGATVIGLAKIIGEADYGTNIQQISFSKVDEDEFGSIKIIKRPPAKLVNYKVTVDTDQLNATYRTLDQLADVAVVWVGTDKVDDETLVFGYHRDNTLEITSPSKSTLSIQVRGLI